MKIVVFLFLFFFQLALCAQQTLIKKIDMPNDGRFDKVVTTTDNGWAFFTLDSLQLLKYDACGNFEWAFKYNVPNRETNTGNVLALQQGGFAITVRALRNIVLIRIDDTGSILWTKTYYLQDFQHFPYNIMEDVNQNLIIYANTGNTVNLTSFSMLLKLDANGSIIWDKKYDTPAIWGEAIHTSDGGYLTRAGGTFVKINSTGGVEWLHQLTRTSRWHLKAVEVADGYIFSGQTSLNEVYFQKMDLLGNATGVPAKYTTNIHTPVQLVKKDNGNVVTVLKEFINGQIQSSVIEFDKDLNTVRRNFIHFSNVGQELNARDLAFTNTGNLVVVGNTEGTDNAFFALTDSSYSTGCDTSLVTPAFTDDFPNINNPTTTSSDYGALDSSYSATAIPISFIDEVWCRDVQLAPVKLGNDTSICLGEPYALLPVNASLFDKFLWSTGDSTSSIAVNDSGTYWVRAVNSCISDTSFDTIRVNYLPFYQTDIGDSVIACLDSIVVLSDSGCINCSYQWNTGDTLNSIQPMQSGNYRLSVTNSSGCTSEAGVSVIFNSCGDSLIIPNVFTPNGDGVNDRFIIVGNIQSFNLEIYNRWGSKIFVSDRQNEGWDGRTQAGKKLSDGTYFYILQLTVYENDNWVDKVYNGSITLLGSN